MSTVSHILLATDLSPASRHAAEHAAAWARRHQAKLHLFYVQTPLQIEYSWLAFAETAEQIEEVQKAADKALQKLASELDAPCTYSSVREPAVAPTVADYARNNAVDLVVVGSHGYKGLAHFALGSVAAEVARLSPVPTLVVSSKHAQPPEELGAILAAVDFSTLAHDAFRYAGQLADAANSKLIAAHVVDPAPLPPYYHDDFLQAGQEQARKSLDQWLAETELSEQAEGVISHGHPHQKLAELAKDFAADLIVMGSQGLRGLDRLLLGSTAERVLRAAPCPVLIYRNDLYA